MSVAAMQYADDALLLDPTAPDGSGDDVATDVKPEATAERTRPSEPQWTIDDFEAAAERAAERASQRMADKLYNSINTRLIPIEQQRITLTELVGDGKRMQAAINTLLDETIGPERREIAAKQIGDKLQQDRILEENAQLKAERATAPKADPQDAAPTPEDASVAITRTINATYLPIYRTIERRARKEGVDMKSVTDSADWPSTPPYDRNGRPLQGAAWTSYWAKFQDDAELALDKQADAKLSSEKAAEPRTRIDTTQPMGGGQNAAALWAAYGRGEVPWSDRVKAADPALRL